MSSRITFGARTFAASLTALLAGLVASPVLAAQASASAEVGASTPPATEPETADTPIAEKPTEGVEPAPMPLPPPPVDVKPEPPKAPLVTIYGILKPEIILAQGAETFGKNMLVAPTAAANPIAFPNYGETALSFQLQQTRFGLKINDGGPISGRIEVDFIDPAFSHSSPIQGTGLRLRLAYVTYKPAEGHAVMIGQNWDIFSPLNAVTMNLVGNSYQAGNSAFLRPQVAYTYGTGQGIEISAAIGLRAQNTNAEMNLLEYGMVPTFALQVGYRTGKTWFGASGIIGAEETVMSPRTYNGAFAGNLFATLALSDTFTLLIDGYIGRSTNALGLLTLGSGQNVVDAGAYASVNWKFAKMHSLWGTAGVAGVLNPEDLAVGYTPGTPAVPPAAAVPAARVGIGGIESNVNLRATYVFSPLEGLQFYAEPFIFITHHKLNAVDDPNGTLASRVAPGLQLGTRYNF